MKTGNCRSMSSASFSEEAFFCSLSYAAQTLRATVTELSGRPYRKYTVDLLETLCRLKVIGADDWFIHVHDRKAFEFQAADDQAA